MTKILVSRESAKAAKFGVFTTREDVVIGRLSWNCNSGSDEAGNGKSGYEELHCCGAVSVMKVIVSSVDVGGRKFRVAGR
jgi:hypothetical protein